MGRIRGVMVGCLVVLSGCSLTGSRGLPPATLYLLEPTAPVTAAGRTERRAAGCRSLRISHPASAPGLLTPKIAYQQQPQQLEYFVLHRWVDAPASMLAEAIAGALQQSGLFSVVLNGSADIPTELRLDIQLTRLRQVINGTESSVELAVRVDLVQLVDRSLLVSEVLAYREQAPANPAAGVAAANRALERLLDDLERLLSAPGTGITAGCASAQRE